jgi:hypothetical protein
MKTIYLWETGEGWKAFDFDSESTKQLLKDRNILIGDGVEIGDEAKIGDGAKMVQIW